MSLAEELERLLPEAEKQAKASPDYERLHEFYKEMQRLGIAQKQVYTLPPLDTIGRGLYQAMPTKENKIP